ncbi:hypothetical protein TUM12370_06900 [Salmonella enterica subsp. enterica serovar Choleraesuis]|nr:hypothetical protein TUM12370_06900 [Salmonella enterica subsp. enterica serovar Choleraesuis]
MKSVKVLQDKLRRKQAATLSLLISTVLLAGLFYIGYEREKYIVSDGVKNFVIQLNNEFIDNELIADAVGVRYYQQRKAGRCGSETQFTHLEDDSYAINTHQPQIDNRRGAIVTRRPDLNALCIYDAAGFIAGKIHQINKDNYYAHRYIVAGDGSFLYWFNPVDSETFTFSSSMMAQDPRGFLGEPPRYYDRLLMKDNHTKAISSTNIYHDKITGTDGYSIVSYIYDLMQREISDDIIGYLVYDHTVSELRGQLQQAFGTRLPVYLNIHIHNRFNGQKLCLGGQCVDPVSPGRQVLSDKYEVIYSLNTLRFLFNGPMGYLLLLAFPLLWLITRRIILILLNRLDMKNQRDPLTGCFNRKALDIVRRKDLNGYAVVQMDCNAFKHINDTLGHDTGDRALKIIAQRMLHGVRDNVDFVIRTGGDEFVIFLHHSSMEQAMRVAQRISGQIERHHFVERGTTVKLSVSYGIAEVTDDVDAAMREADERMYLMKRGRAAVTEA